MHVDAEKQPTCVLRSTILVYDGVDGSGVEHILREPANFSVYATHINVCVSVCAWCGNGVDFGIHLIQ